MSRRDGLLGRCALSWLALIRPVAVVRAALRPPAVGELVAPQAPALVVAVLGHLVHAREYPHTELLLVPVTLATGLLYIAVAAGAALGCGWLAQRLAGLAPVRPFTLSLATGGAYAFVPWTALVIWHEVTLALEPAARGLGPAWDLVRDWPYLQPGGDVARGWATRPGSAGFWVCVVWGLAITGLALWRALPRADARARLRFGLLWAVAFPALAAACITG
jgi:hypothetical protein